MDQAKNAAHFKTFLLILVVSINRFCFLILLHEFIWTLIAFLRCFFCIHYRYHLFFWQLRTLKRN